MWNKLKKKPIIRWAVLIGGAAVFILVILIVMAQVGVVKMGGEEPSQQEDEKGGSTTELHRVPKLDYKVDLLTPNRFSRPQLELKKVNAVVVHYVSNPGTTAKDNRDYFNNLSRINEGKASPVFASAHFVIGLKGEILQCIPLAEMAYASNSRNSDTIAIECCHPDEDGKFTSETYASLINALTYLCIRYGLDPSKDIIRHYDVTGKMCPKYYVKHPEAWKKLVEDAKKSVEKTKEELKKESIPYDLEDANGKVTDNKETKSEKR